MMAGNEAASAAPASSNNSQRPQSTDCRYSQMKPLASISTIPGIIRTFRLSFHPYSAGQRLPIMKLADKIIVSPQVVAREVGNETVILDLVSGNYFGLDRVGARMWQLIEAGKSLAAVRDAMADEYNVSLEVLERDVLALARDLVEKKLVSIE